MHTYVSALEVMIVISRSPLNDMQHHIHEWFQNLNKNYENLFLVY